MYQSHLLERSSLIALLVSFLAWIAPLTTAQAEHKQHRQSNDRQYDWEHAPWNDHQIIVFSECDYKGRFKVLREGDYETLRQVGVEHNAISSIYIPDGMAAELFQRRGFRGHWYRINRSEACLPGKWDNRSGAMRVMVDDPRNSFGFQDDYRRRGDGNMQFGRNGWDNTPGFGRRYSSGVPGGENWGNDYRRNWFQRFAQNQGGGSNQPKNNNCQPYSVSGNHPDVGIRFLAGDHTFHLTGTGTTNARVCHRGQVRVELAKKRAPAEVVLRIGGRNYVFRGGDSGDQYRNGWYRKYFTVSLR